MPYRTWPSESDFIEHSDDDDVLRALLEIKAIKKHILSSKTLVSQRRCNVAQAELQSLSTTFEHNCRIRDTLEQKILSTITRQRIRLDDIGQVNQQVMNLKAQSTEEQMAIRAQESALDTLLSEKRRLKNALNEVEREEEKIKILLSRET